MKFIHSISLLLACTAFADQQMAQEPISVPAVDKVIPGGSPIEVCDEKEKQLIDIEYVSISPNPPVKGENLTITAIGTLKTDVTEGAYVDVDVRYGYIRLIHQTYDLCEQLVNVDMSCPVKKGYLELTKTVELPNEIPPGKYVVNAHAYTADDELLTCLFGQIEFSV